MRFLIIKYIFIFLLIGQEIMNLIKISFIIICLNDPGLGCMHMFPLMPSTCDFVQLRLVQYFKKFIYVIVIFLSSGCVETRTNGEADFRSENSGQQRCEPRIDTVDFNVDLLHLLIHLLKLPYQVSCELPVQFYPSKLCQISPFMQYPSLRQFTINKHQSSLLRVLASRYKKEVPKSLEMVSNDLQCLIKHSGKT